MDFPVESYSFLPGSSAILDLSYRSRLRNSNYTISQQSRPTVSMPLPDNVINMATEFGDKGKSVWNVFYSFMDFGM